MFTAYLEGDFYIFLYSIYPYICVVSTIINNPHQSDTFVIIDELTLKYHNHLKIIVYIRLGFPCSSAGKESTCNVGDLGLIPGLGRSPGEGKGYPLQYSGLENSMDCIVHRVTKSRTRLRDFHFTSLHRDNKQVSGFQGLVGNKGF